MTDHHSGEGVPEGWSPAPDWPGRQQPGTRWGAPEPYPLQPGPQWGSAAGGPPPSYPDRPPSHKPGPIPLRPLGVGDMISGSFASVFANARVCFGVAAVVFGVVAVVGIVAALILQITGSFDRVSFVSVSTVLPASLASAAGVLLSGILSYSTVNQAAGRKPTFGEVVHQMRPRVPVMIGTLVVIVLCGIVLAIPAMAVFLVGLFTIDGVGVVLLALVALFLLLIPLLWFAVVSAAALPVAALDHAGPVAALKRSMWLAKGAFGQYLGVLILMGIITSVVQRVIQTPLGALASLIADRSADGVGMIVVVVAGFIAGLITTPFTAAAHALIYIDARIRHEAFDLTLARLAGAAAAGEYPPGQPPMPPPDAPWPPA